MDPLILLGAVSALGLSLLISSKEFTPFMRVTYPDDHRLAGLDVSKAVFVKPEASYYNVTTFSNPLNGAVVTVREPDIEKFAITVHDMARERQRQNLLYFNSRFPESGDSTGVYHYVRPIYAQLPNPEIPELIRYYK